MQRGEQCRGVLSLAVSFPSMFESNEAFSSKLNIIHLIGVSVEFQFSSRCRSESCGDPGCALAGKKCRVVSRVLVSATCNEDGNRAQDSMHAYRPVT